MYQKLKKMQPSLVNRKGIILLNDNACPQFARITMKKLNRLSIEPLPHPPYSPNISPTDYHMFKHLSHFLKEKTFHNQEDAELAVKDFIYSRSTSFYTDIINNLSLRWQECIDTKGSYFD